MAKKRMGKGLGALLNTEEAVDNVLDNSGIIELKLTEIEPNQGQPRTNFDSDRLEALAESVKEYGVLQPIVVKKLETGFYKLIAGERRWRAARMAGLKKIPAIIREYDDKETMEIALIENLQREDLNSLEEAQGFKELMDVFGLTQEQLSVKMGKSRSAIANSVRLLQLPDEIKDYITDGTLSAGHARALLATDKKAVQLAAAEKIIKENYNVRQTESYIASLLKEKKEKKKPIQNEEMKRYIFSLENHLAEQLGTKVNIHHNKNKGKIEIQYYSNEDFERIMEIINKGNVGKN